MLNSHFLLIVFHVVIDRISLQDLHSLRWQVDIVFPKGTTMHPTTPRRSKTDAAEESDDSSDEAEETFWKRRDARRNAGKNPKPRRDSEPADDRAHASADDDGSHESKDGPVFVGHIVHGNVGFRNRSEVHHRISTRRSLDRLVNRRRNRKQRRRSTVISWHRNRRPTGIRATTRYGIKYGQNYRISLQVDVWGFGVVLWQMTQQTPFNGVETSKLDRPVGRGLNGLQRTFSAQLPIPAGLPTAIAALLAACLQPNPSDRPTFAEIGLLIVGWPRIEKSVWMRLKA
jgi:hypothetical protein